MTESLNNKILCDIYKSDKKDEMYLYVPKSIGQGWAGKYTRGIEAELWCIKTGHHISLNRVEKTGPRRYP